VLVVAALGLAACGGRAPVPPLSEGEYLGRARLICQELDRQAGRAGDGLIAAAGTGSPGALADARRVVAGFVPVVAEAHADLAGLVPPEAKAGAAADYLAALDRARARLAAAGSSDQATRRLLDGGPELLAGLAAPAARLGLEGCGSARTAADAAADDETAMASLRTALATEQLLLAGDDRFSDDPRDFLLLQPDGVYEVGASPPRRPGPVAVQVDGGGTEVFLSSRSRSGTCFYVAASADGRVGFARDPSCAAAADQAYAPAW